MKLSEKQNQLFVKGSKTYYLASRFFDSKTRADITTLYAFVRMADNFVDDQPQDKDGFLQFVKQWQNYKSGQPVTNKVVAAFGQLVSKSGIAPIWVDAFLSAMKQDLTKKKYASLDETLSYIYGSAEVIGLMLNRIFNIDQSHDLKAQLMGRSMQYANFLRDIQEDNSLGRQYISTSLLQKYGLSSLSEKECQKKRKSFNKMIRAEVARYQGWRQSALKSMSAIPRQSRIAVYTADAMYAWTASQIARDPLRVFHQKIKPSKFRIIITGICFTILVQLKLK